MWWWRVGYDNHRTVKLDAMRVPIAYADIDLQLALLTADLTYVHVVYMYITLLYSSYF